MSEIEIFNSNQSDGYGIYIYRISFIYIILLVRFSCHVVNIKCIIYTMIADIETRIPLRNEIHLYNTSILASGQRLCENVSAFNTRKRKSDLLKRT